MDALRRLTAGDDEGREAMRAVAALLLGLGFAMILIRKDGTLGESWAAFPILVVVLIPAVTLYGFGFLAARSDGPRPWQAVFIVLGLVFSVLTLFQLVDVLGGSPDSSLNTFWIFGVVAGLAFAAGFRADVRFALLFGGVAALVSLLGLFDELVDLGSDLGTFRGICILIALGLGAFGFLVIRRDPAAGGRRGGEILTSAGIAFLVGAGLVTVATAAQSVVPAVGATTGAGFEGADTNLFWDLVLLVGSLGLVVAGNRFDARGPCYVGAAGLLTFVIVAGFDLDDPTPEPSLIGWPLLLLLLGAAAFALSAVGSLKLGPRSTPGPGTGEATAVHESPRPAPPAPPAAAPEPPPARPETPPAEPPPEDPGAGSSGR